MGLAVGRLVGWAVVGRAVGGSVVGIGVQVSPKLSELTVIPMVAGCTLSKFIFSYPSMSFRSKEGMLTLKVLVTSDTMKSENGIGAKPSKPGISSPSVISSIVNDFNIPFRWTCRATFRPPWGELNISAGNVLVLSSPLV